jgi:gentisate 1,2-dioxygenase
MQQNDGMAHTVNRAAEAARAPFYEKARTQNLAPLWRVIGGLVPEEPVTPCKAAIWHYKDVRPYLMEACELIRAEEAERRVMILENPGLPGESRITRSLFAGLQTILPGETAPAHRHMASALRFIIEGHDAFTAVEGEKTMMEPGDFVITPSMTWHDHGNESDAPMVWLDGLDMHMVNMFDTSFRDGFPEDRHPAQRATGASNWEWGMNMLPVDSNFGAKTSPIFSYPYKRTRETLDHISRQRDPEPWHGHRMRYINPVTGDWAMPTISTCMQLLPKGFKTTPYRSTAGTVFAVVEGTGSSIIGGEKFDWEPHDIFVAPSWMFQEHTASSDAMIFSFSDRVAQEKLGFFREQKGNQ